MARGKEHLKPASKRLVSQTLPSLGLLLKIGGTWASVEVTSEETGYPIESTLLRAKSLVGVQLMQGLQIIRLIFEWAAKLTGIGAVYEDAGNTRMQKFVLRWSADTEHSSPQFDCGHLG